MAMVMPTIPIRQNYDSAHAVQQVEQGQVPRTCFHSASSDAAG